MKKTVSAYSHTNGPLKGALHDCTLLNHLSWVTSPTSFPSAHLFSVSITNSHDCFLMFE